MNMVLVQTLEVLKRTVEPFLQLSAVAMIVGRAHE